MSDDLDEARLAVLAEADRHGRSDRQRVLRLYRLHLQSTITEISPLAIDLAAHGGYDLAGIASLITVPPRWRPTMLQSRRAMPLRSRSRPVIPTIREARSSVTLPWRDGLEPALSFFPREPIFEVAARLGSVTIATHGTMVDMLVEADLPEGVRSSLVGRPLTDAISHPVLDDRGYVIEEVYDDIFCRGTVLSFRAGLLPHAMPWGKEIEAAIERRRVQEERSKKHVEALCHVPDRAASHYSGGSRQRISRFPQAPDPE